MSGGMPMRPSARDVEIQSDWRGSTADALRAAHVPNAPTVTPWFRGPPTPADAAKRAVLNPSPAMRAKMLRSVMQSTA